MNLSSEFPDLEGLVRRASLRGETGEAPPQVAPEQTERKADVRAQKADLTVFQVESVGVEAKIGVVAAGKIAEYGRNEDSHLHETSD